MLGTVLSWLGGPLANALTAAYKAKLAAQNDEQRIAAEVVIADIQRQMAAARDNADVIKTGMQFKIFWIPWSMAAIPLAAWFGWGVLDSAIYDGTMLPNVAALPPQLKDYADDVWNNLFYSGGAVATAQAALATFRGRR